MIEINLVPDVKLELLKAQRIRAAVISGAVVIGIAAAGVVVALALYVFGAQTALNAFADNAIKDESAKLSSVEDLSKTLTLQNQLLALGKQYDEKKIDSRLFAVLTAIIPPSPNDVKLSTVSLDSETGSITLEGQAANSYAAVEVFKKTIDAAQVKFTDSDNKQQEVKLASNISTGDTSYGEDASGSKVLRFTISFEYAPELFAALSKNATIVIGTTGNVTDSYLGVPESIFTDRASDLEKN